nr:MAG TPA: hypothetical protein [Crassvirales sp.]DAV76847.1 MAG TPA: hypothetical protein [Caudoviricetes sp.]
MLNDALELPAPAIADPVGALPPIMLVRSLA